MANFRTSTVPDWATNENNGYFRSRNSGGNSPGNRQLVQSQTQSAQSTLPPKSTRCLSKDVETAGSNLKQNRVKRSWRHICIMQMAMFTIMFIVFPMESEHVNPEAKSSALVRIIYTIFQKVICIKALICVVALYFTLNMFAVALTRPSSYGTCILEQINQVTSHRFILKIFMTFSFVILYYLYFLELFEPDTINVYGHADKEEHIVVFFEDRIALRVSVGLAALDFFISSYWTGELSLKFPSVPVIYHTGSLIDLQEIKQWARASFFISIAAGLGCLLIGPLTVNPAIQFLSGVKISEGIFFDRFCVFVNLGFMIKLFSYTLLMRSFPLLLLQLLNTNLTQFVDFHVESETNHEKCILLSEAMNGKNVYLKYLAFYEYCFKTDGGDRDVSVFYKITHPGNHPVNWRNVFNPSIEVVKQMNEMIVRFLKTSKMPENFLQSGLGPYILNQLRDCNTANDKNGVTAAPNEPPRGGNMRDLTSLSRPEFPDGPPNIADLLYLHLIQQWNYIKGTVFGFFTIQSINNLIFGGRLEIKLPEYVIANILSDHLLSYWAITGTLNLMYKASGMDLKGVVHQDIKPFMLEILATYDSLIALEIYVTKSLDDEPRVDRIVSEKNKEIVMKLANACVFTIAKLHQKFCNCYSILDIDENIQMRIQEVIHNRDHP